MNATGNETSRSAQKKSPNESTDEPRKARAPQRNGRTEPETPERRAAERRYRNLPVMLDTRLRQIRRRKAENSKIDLQV